MLLDTKAVAALLGVKVNTIYVYRYRDTFPPPVDVYGRSPVWEQDQIIDWARKEGVGRYKYE